MPTFLRVMTSSAVYSSRSLATPWKSISLLVKGPTVTKGASFPVLGSWYGAAIVMQDDYLWKKIFGELHASRNKKVPIVGSHHILMLCAVPQ